MSKQSYINGFVKVATDNGVDAVELAKYAFSMADVTNAISNVGNRMSKAWSDIPTDAKPLAGALLGGGGGAAGGALLGKLLGFGAGKGALAGLGLGGVGGSLLGSRFAGKEREAKRLADLAALSAKNDKALAGLVSKHKSDMSAAGKKYKSELDSLRSQLDESKKALEDARGQLADTNRHSSAVARFFRDRGINPDSVDIDTLPRLRQVISELKSKEEEMVGDSNYQYFRQMKVMPKNNK